MKTRPDPPESLEDVPLRPPRSGVRRLHRWLLLLPFGWQLALAPWANGLDARPLGLPFPMVWQMAGVVLASACIAVVLVLDRRADAADVSRRLTAE